MEVSAVGTPTTSPKVMFQANVREQTVLSAVSLMVQVHYANTFFWKTSVL
jgi:hypothetical protein